MQQLRESLGLMQAELAEKLGVGRTTLASWETGHRKPELAHLEALADLGGVSVDWLLGRTDQTADKPEAADLLVIFRGKRLDLSDAAFRIAYRIFEGEVADRAKHQVKAAGDSEEAPK